MNAYKTGFQDGLVESRKDQSRKYETDKAEKAYWEGYIDGVKHSNPGKHIVKCNREGRIFATDNTEDCICPTCGRRYVGRESDRPLTVIS